jgi:hypothetical protein
VLQNKACHRTHTHTQSINITTHSACTARPWRWRQSVAHPERGLLGCSPPNPPNPKRKKYKFCRYYDITNFAVFTLQPISDT